MPHAAWYGPAFALAGGASALVPALAMWGFTVDDALISLRYAHNVIAGAGYRFDALGPSTDGVTPLPWATLIAPLAAGVDLVAALERVKMLGIVAWTIAGAVLGLALARRAARERRATLHAVFALVIVSLAFPIGAWAASGMETGIATALATCAAVSFERPRRAAVLAGLAATLRPELVVWAAVVAGGAAVAASRARRARTSTPAIDLAAGRDAGLALALAAGPFVACALVRLVVWGRAAPLALMAKPSDAAHGFTYAVAASLVVLTPLLVFAPLALTRASALSKTLAVAAAVHVVAVVAVGGDWMPFARLMVPIAPSLALAFVDVGRVARGWSTLARGILALALGLVVAVRAAPAGRHVHEARKDLVARATPSLAGAKVVAALDVGWVGASTPARIVDLAGLTDPSIAALPGGHTSKAVDLAMLLDRHVDTVILYGEPRLVERRLRQSPFFEEKFERYDAIAFGEETNGQRPRYDFYRRRP